MQVCVENIDGEFEVFGCYIGIGILICDDNIVKWVNFSQWYEVDCVQVGMLQIVIDVNVFD